MAKEQSAIKEHIRSGLQEPKRYKVVIFNDDFTTQEFVVEVLMTVFFKTKEEATALMLKVHNGKGAVVGVYSYDVAVSKVQKATKMARERNYPLRLEVQPED